MSRIDDLYEILIDCAYTKPSKLQCITVPSDDFDNFVIELNSHPNFIVYYNDPDDKYPANVVCKDINYETVLYKHYGTEPLIAHFDIKAAEMSTITYNNDDFYED